MNQNFKYSHTRYRIHDWNRYAGLHASVTTTKQLEMYYDAATYLTGNVVDFGCGTAKIAPLLDAKSVETYTGVDLSKDMVDVASATVKSLCSFPTEIRHCEIDAITGQFDSAVSIQSYYAWSEPIETLKRIKSVLAVEGRFVLANANENLRLDKLLEQAERELAWHPDFAEFKAYNLELKSNNDAYFPSMDQLIRDVQLAGFRVLECHQRHFEGGLNFLVLV